MNISNQFHDVENEQWGLHAGKSKQFQKDHILLEEKSNHVERFPRQGTLCE